MKFISKAQTKQAAELIVARAGECSCFIVGINGAQGSGKSVFSRNLQQHLEDRWQRRTVILELDDLYLTRKERQQLAAEIHPLLVTRGVPGTHDVKLGLKILRKLKKSNAKTIVEIPRFAKELDDRLPPKQWQRIAGKVDIVLFEGWCVGAKPQSAMELKQPLNELEAKEDASGIWRGYVNEKLAEDYSSLFGLLDMLIMLKLPNFAEVFKRRWLQEKNLMTHVSSKPSKGQLRIMSKSELKRFILYYQRVTEWMLQEMPQRADLVLIPGGVS